MFKPRSLLVAGVASTALLLVALAPHTSDFFGAGPAFAKNDNNNGNGRGNGRDRDEEQEANNDHPGNSGNAPGHSDSSGSSNSVQAANAGSPGNSGNAPGRNKPTDTDAVLFQANGNHLPGLDSQIASLHAANANINAFLHAADGSKIGLIRYYAEKGVALEVAEGALADAQQMLTDADGNLMEAMDAYNMALADLGLDPETTTVDDLLAAEAALLAMPDPDAEQLAAVQAALAAADDLADAQMAFDDADQALMDAQMAYDEADMAATDALNDAANQNKLPVSDEVREWLDAQLEEGGVFDLFRVEGEEEAIVVAQ